MVWFILILLSLTFIILFSIVVNLCFMRFICSYKHFYMSYVKKRKILSYYKE